LLVLEAVVVVLPVTKVWVQVLALVVYFLAHLLLNKIILTQYLLVVAVLDLLAQMELEQTEDPQQLLV
jgi:hypothetical protein